MRLFGVGCLLAWLALVGGSLAELPPVSVTDAAIGNNAPMPLSGGTSNELGLTGLRVSVSDGGVWEAYALDQPQGNFHLFVQRAPQTTWQETVSDQLPVGTSTYQLRGTGSSWTGNAVTQLQVSWANGPAVTVVNGQTMVTNSAAGNYLVTLAFTWVMAGAGGPGFSDEFSAYSVGADGYADSKGVLAITVEPQLALAGLGVSVSDGGRWDAYALDQPQNTFHLFLQRAPQTTWRATADATDRIPLDVTKSTTTTYLFRGTGSSWTGNAVTQLAVTWVNEQVVTITNGQSVVVFSDVSASRVTLAFTWVMAGAGGPGFSDEFSAYSVGPDGYADSTGLLTITVEPQLVLSGLRVSVSDGGIWDAYALDEPQGSFHLFLQRQPQTTWQATLQNAVDRIALEVDTTTTTTYAFRGTGSSWTGSAITQLAVTWMDGRVVTVASGQSVVVSSPVGSSRVTLAFTWVMAGAGGPGFSDEFSAYSVGSDGYADSKGLLTITVEPQLALAALRTLVSDGGIWDAYGLDQPQGSFHLFLQHAPETTWRATADPIIDWTPLEVKTTTTSSYAFRGTGSSWTGSASTQLAVTLTDGRVVTVTSGQSVVVVTSVIISRVTLSFNWVMAGTGGPGFSDEFSAYSVGADGYPDSKGVLTITVEPQLALAGLGVSVSDGGRWDAYALDQPQNTFHLFLQRAPQTTWRATADPTLDWTPLDVSAKTTTTFAFRGTGSSWTGNAVTQLAVTLTDGRVVTVTNGQSTVVSSDVISSRVTLAFTWVMAGAGGPGFSDEFSAYSVGPDGYADSTGVLTVTVEPQLVLSGLGVSVSDGGHWDAYGLDQPQNTFHLFLQRQPQTIWEATLAPTVDWVPLDVSTTTKITYAFRGTGSSWTGKAVTQLAVTWVNGQVVTVTSGESAVVFSAVTSSLVTLAFNWVMAGAGGPGFSDEFSAYSVGPDGYADSTGVLTITVEPKLVLAGLRVSVDDGGIWDAYGLNQPQGSFHLFLQRAPQTSWQPALAPTVDWVPVDVNQTTTVTYAFRGTGSSWTGSASTQLVVSWTDGRVVTVPNGGSAQLLQATSVVKLAFTWVMAGAGGPGFSDEFSAYSVGPDGYPDSKGVLTITVEPLPVVVGLRVLVSDGGIWDAYGLDRPCGSFHLFVQRAPQSTWRDAVDDQLPIGNSTYAFRGTASSWTGNAVTQLELTFADRQVTTITNGLPVSNWLSAGGGWRLSLTFTWVMAGAGGPGFSDEFSACSVGADGYADSIGTLFITVEPV